jgi:plasmid stabilization system protein ParE
MTVRFSPRALADLEAIQNYLLPLNPRGAERVRQAIVATIDHIAAFPRSSVETDEPGLLRRPLVRYRYTIYYRLASTGHDVEIVRVLYSGRVKNLRRLPDAE